MNSLLDGWIGIIALTGWRTSFSPDLIFYDFFKDKSKEEKKELEKFIIESRNELRKLQKQYENMQDEHIQLKQENELNYKNLKSRHEKISELVCLVWKKTVERNH